MILLTGASGFIGKHLLNRLIEIHGHDKVVALTSRPLAGAQYLLHNDYSFSPAMFEKAGEIKTVIHAGAFTPKNAKEAADWQRCDSNIINTHNLLKNLPQSVERFIFLSTLDVYGNTDIITEAGPIEPVSLYGHSKLYNEKQVEKWAEEQKKIAQVLRIGHVYGPGEEQYEKIIPNTIKKLLKGEPMQISGTGNDIRTFIYIKDAVEAIAAALKVDEYTGPVNIVGEHGISIKDLVISLQKIAGNSDDIEYVASSRPVRNLYFNNSRMKTLLGGEKYTLEAGLKEEWAYMSALK